jgi:hypothetical protein
LVILTLAAGLAMWLNVRNRCDWSRDTYGTRAVAEDVQPIAAIRGIDGPTAEGWPLIYRTSYVAGSSEHVTWRPWALVLDFLVSAGTLSLLAVALEFSERIRASACMDRKTKKPWSYPQC